MVTVDVKDNTLIYKDENPHNYTWELDDNDNLLIWDKDALVACHSKGKWESVTGTHRMFDGQ